MAFWGVEIKPGKPYSHKQDNFPGRLRISQATLGNANGKSTGKSTIQCNVGNKAPILLCHLIPNTSETCHLELEFEEPQEVVFSVLGQRSVHLSGYHIDRTGRGRDLDGDETDSYGEDIADTDGSASFGDDDEYESDFIDDDDDIEMYPHRRKSGVVIEEIEEDDKPSENAKRRRLKKKHQLSDSDDGADGSQGQLLVKRNRSSAVLESEDEDGFPISFSSRKQNVVKDMGNSDSKSDEKTGDEGMKMMTDLVSQDDASARDTSQPSDTALLSEDGQENDKRSKKKKKKKKSTDGKPLDTTSEAPADEGTSVAAEQDKEEKDVGINMDNEVQLVCANVETKIAGNDGTDSDKKSKKKKKKKKSKTTEAGADESVERTECKFTEDTKEESNNELDQDPHVNGELGKLANPSEVVDPSVPSVTDTEANGKLNKKNKKKRAKDDRGPDAEGGEVADANQTDAKKKRKNNKSIDKDLASANESGEPGKTEAAKTGLKTRNFSNGLVIEDLAMGKPDGEKAVPGKKVSVSYIGKLKNGKIFDSNVGKRPFSFRLGIGQVIKGWDVGVNGMRIGDKRRLTIPPAYGYGQKQTGPIPPNSWLHFDVELVSVK